MFEDSAKALPSAPPLHPHFYHSQTEKQKESAVINSRVQSYIKARVNIHDCGCWLWTRATDNRGYGSLTMFGKRHKAHRLSYSVFVEEIPIGMCVLHKCDTPACVNPSHLEIGTKKENTRQMCARGRAKGGAINPLKGESHGGSKLTDIAISMIRLDRRRHREIAEDYGISQTNVSFIKSGKRWGHLNAD